MGTEDGFFLQPAPLYGSDELSIGAVQLSDGGQLLLLCDDTDRALNTGKPLVLYLDGEYLSLNWTESQIQAAVGCDAFRTDLETLDKVSTVERAMLRVHFTDETVEHRISGTTADYFSRPKIKQGHSKLTRGNTEKKDLSVNAPLTTEENY